MSSVSTHVLDTALGRPAMGVEVRLERADGSLVAAASTDADGRVRALGPDDLPAGTYRLVFDTGTHFERQATVSFFPQVSVSFVVTDGHHHVPLLLSPFAYSTYRGS